MTSRLVAAQVDNPSPGVQAAGYRILLMKVVLIALGSLLTINAFAAGSEAIIRDRAKELSNQNNVRQGVAPPAPSQPAAAANKAAPPAAAMSPIGRVQLDIAAIKPTSPVTPAQKQQLARDLAGLAQGSKKPSFPTVNKLAEDMATALSQKPVTEGARSRLVQDLNAAMNPANLQPTQMQDIVADVQAVFQSAGVPRKDAVTISDGVKAISAELQKSAK